MSDYCSGITGAEDVSQSQPAQPTLPAVKPPAPPKPVKNKAAKMVPIQDAINVVATGGEATPPSKPQPPPKPVSYAKPIKEQTFELEAVSSANAASSEDRNSVLRNSSKSGYSVGTTPPPSLRQQSSGKGNWNRAVRDPVSNDIARSSSSVSGRADTVRESSASSRDTESSLLPHARPIGLQPGEPNNKIYHLVRYSQVWVLLLLVIHVCQFTLLLTVGYNALSAGAFAIVFVLVVAVAILMVCSRFFVKKSHMSEMRNVKLRGGVCTPDDEADKVPDRVVYMVAAAAILEGIAFAIFSVTSAGNNSHLSTSGFYTQTTLLQTLRFTSITLLALHRTLRPANRLDPLRTVIELEIVSVCWDALDGSTLYELLDDTSLGNSTANAVRALMVFWYLSVGVRMAMVILTQLNPTAPIYHYVTTYPFQLDPQPTVDRTLQGLRLRSLVTVSMAFADLFAASIRLKLWIEGKLDPLQQDMCIKNFLFMATVGFAVANFRNTTTRQWNKRAIIEKPPHFVLKRPRREIQMQICRWAFVATYMLVSLLLTIILVKVTESGSKWVGNLLLDAMFSVLFLLYCRNVHVHDPTSQPPTYYLLPHKSFFDFPGRLAFCMSVLLGASLLVARIPALYLHYSSLEGNSSGGGLYLYDNAMLIVVLSLLPIGFFAFFWTTAYMVFRKEFTASPGNYNAIHDPSIKLVALSTITEGALDVLSCVQLMQLAENNLPDAVNGAVIFFCLLEMINGCQSFALNIMLSGGHDDTPKDLIRWNAYLRVSRGVIDFGTIVLRLVLWIRYNAISSVFLVKNLYNLIHTGSQIERFTGTNYYPKGTLFSEFVPPSDWYGMSKEQWRAATRETINAQAQAGRRV